MQRNICSFYKIQIGEPCTVILVLDHKVGEAEVTQEMCVLKERKNRGGKEDDTPDAKES